MQQLEKRLPNGAIELDRRPLRDGSFVILAQRDDDSQHPEYVTWREFEGYTKWGHYFPVDAFKNDETALAEARQDFETR